MVFSKNLKMTNSVKKFRVETKLESTRLNLRKQSRMSKVELFLDQDQISNLQNILSQSEVGIHLLFDNQMISEVYKEEVPEDEFFEVENIKKVQDDLFKLLQIKKLTDKQDFVRGLSPIGLKRLIRAYFYIIENKAQQAQRLRH